MVKDKLKQKKLFLLDMDGTIYLDSVLFEYSLDFLNFKFFYYIELLESFFSKKKYVYLGCTFPPFF